MSSSCDKQATCGGCEDSAAADVELNQTCPKPNYIENRMVYQPEQCAPRVVTTSGGTVAVSGDACNLTGVVGGALLTKAYLMPDDNGIITWGGCGTQASGWKPVFNLTALADAILPTDTTAYVTEDKCGWKWSDGKLVTRGKLITNLGSSDDSLDVSWDATTCSYDIKLPATTTSPTLDPAAEFAVITSSSTTVPGQKYVTVNIAGAKAGSTGTASVTPDVGATPAPQNYTAASNGTATMQFAIDSAASAANVTGTNSSRYLISPSATHTIPC